MANNVELILSLAGGNPGAISVCARLNNKELNALKDSGVSGFRIWLLYKDILGENIEMMWRVLDEVDEDRNLRQVLAKYVSIEKIQLLA